MSDYSEILALDKESLNTLGEVYYGYAEVLCKTEKHQFNPYIASSYTISAIMKSIIQPGSGKKSFRKAAEYYKIDGNNYWLICSICSYDINRILEYPFNEKSEFQSGILEKLLIRNLVDKKIYNELEFYNDSIPLGRLNIPAKIYINALNDVLKINTIKFNKNASFSDVFTFLERSSESIYFLKEDSFHWQYLLGDFVPLEPEILAFCIVLCKKFRDANISVNKILEQDNIDLIAKLPLQIANEIYSIELQRESNL